jgi:ribosomal-protein-alanine N-acetyltransferase
VIVESLSNKHFDLLFEFESENRQWFESLISSRGNHFYTYAGVKKHILDSALLAKLGTHYSAVLIVNNTIVARGNLKNIDTKNNSCSVGYRVAEKYLDKGYASYCLAELIRIAKNSYSISKVEAKVLDNNPASIAVLKKQGFNILYHEPNFTVLNGNHLGCTTFECLPG